MEKNTNIYSFPSEEGNDEININSLIDALFDIRLSLSIKRITSPTIKKDELRSIINNTKNDKDEAVKHALDDVFEKYVGKELVNKDKYTINDIEKIIEQRIRYEQTKELKDKSLVLNQDKAA